MQLIIIPGEAGPPPTPPVSAAPETQPEARADLDFLTDEYERMSGLIRACEFKPDPAWFGCLRLSEETFEKTFRSLSEYLGNLLEKHRGEAIVLDRVFHDRDHVAFVRKSDYDVFHPCFYGNSHAPADDAQQERDIKWHAQNLAPAAASGAKLTRSRINSWEYLRRIPNSVLNPREEGETDEYFLSDSTEVAYHTLASLVYQLCGEFTLLDIYTFYCQQEILIGVAPHSQQSYNSRGAKGGARSWGKWR